MIARIDNNYVGPRTDATCTVNDLRRYDLTNLRIGVEGSAWKAALFAKNLFNQQIVLSDATQINLNAGVSIQARRHEYLIEVSGIVNAQMLRKVLGAAR